MDIYLVRHGESQFNAGQTTFLDSDLTPRGQQQAKLTAERLSGESLTRAYVSPLRRTLQTIAPICKACDLQAEVNADVCEFFSPHYPDFKRFPGLSPTDIRTRYPFTVFGETFPCDEAWWPQEFEDDRAIYTRACRVRDTLLRLYAQTNERVLIVSHADTVGRLTEAFQRVPPHPNSPPWSDNCGITRLAVSDNSETPAAMVYQNETTHLDGLSEDAA